MTEEKVTYIGEVAVSGPTPPGAPYSHVDDPGDVHPQYQKESEKNQASGYPGLDAGSKVVVGQIPTLNAATNIASLDNTGKVPLIELATGTADATKFMRGDRTWANTGVMAEGTAFPSGPTTNQRFYRTDRKIEYVWDGTRWLCTCPHRAPIPMQDALAPYTGTAALDVGRLPADIEYAMWLEAIVYSTFVQTTNDASNYHNLNLLDAAGIAIAGAAATTAAQAANMWVSQRKVLGLATSTVKFHLRLSVKTGTPGSIYFIGVLHYRLIG